MSEFSLIKKMSTIEDEPTTILPEGIEYTQFIVEVGKERKVVNIPIKEAENFQKRLAEFDTRFNRVTPKVFKQMLREFRGIRESVK